ncbi:bifunctional phosphopantothenoylcysteine decarboxylase/phosphopantothenate--cysteine ligase CoaBC [Suicoccus acidiformans]|uniref:Coenzyme A biosynthesis bifunctional protein CoaBC n=1 Tax=Suicoccus acidiformans TaxID=2036206 RepID=A0A347WL59_9LACT|nr:bifunctional phosphopantothenoylcysteine decarboxylase/phosphopantothenate--cysteine ligase CoaBC [Suicoccus acidiformans]AXY25816.1 bifunctional phosphopantothenoylcysteine decarboxylase/phosphopantothenate--cysteine ligase CoaBC [Suicoccus acidiformans]
MLENQRIALYITGGIASYKMGEFARRLIKAGCDVRVAMTESAQAFITPLTLQTLTKHKVLVDTFDEDDPAVVQHIHLADWTDFAIVAPATANILGKMAHGIADDIVSSCLMATNVPTIVFPAMNTKMYDNPATQRNIAQLEADGKHIVQPATGFLAEGYEGRGRLPDYDTLMEEVTAFVARHTLPQVLSGQRVLISAGGTVEAIDPVRYISNRSSGKMGYALAQAASWLGGDVTLVSTTKALTEPAGVQVEYVQSARELHERMHHYFEQADIVIMAAAVSDYRAKNIASSKIKKSQQDTQVMQIDLEENPDILASLGAKKALDQVLIGFAAETDDVLDNARAKLRRKGADWIIANDVSDQSIGFNSDENQVTLISQDQEISLPRMRKEVVALEVFQTLFADCDERA